YYILDDDNKNIRKEYKTVVKKIERNNTIYIKNYQSKGVKYPILDGEYFYIVNDFSHYIGFTPETRVELHQLLVKNYKALINQNSSKKPLETTQKEELYSLWELLIKDSYFGWKENPEDFVRKLTKKSGVIKRNKEGHY